jgi:hypothetical protein
MAHIMRTATTSHAAFLLPLLLTANAAATGACTAGSSDAERAPQTGEALGIIRPPPSGPSNQSFLAPASWSHDFGSSQGWNPTTKHVRVLADIDGDGKRDIVGFGDAGVYVARSTGAAFEGARFVLAQFGAANGWTDDQTVRTTADLNGDGRADVVGFGADGVWTALSVGASFAAPRHVLADFGTNRGWHVAKHVRTMADVNGDGHADIVGFGDAGVIIAIGDGTGGFAPASFAIPDFGANQGWDPSLHVRTTGDVDGDGRADIVAFGNDGVWTALSSGTGFAPRAFVLAAFGNSGAAGGWTGGGRHERRVVDIDGDRKADLVGFGESGTYVAHATGGGGFGAVTNAGADFGFTQMGYASVAGAQRYIADFNGDGHVDIVGLFDGVAIRRSVGGAGGSFFPSVNLMNIVGNIGGQIEAADVDGDGKPDLVGFGVSDVFVERSTANPPPPPPNAPSNLAITSASSNAIALSWSDNSSDEVAFIMKWQDPISHAPGDFVTGANITHGTATGLRSNTTFCFTATAVGWFGNTSSPTVCGKTLVQGPSVTVTTTTHTSIQFDVESPGATALRWHLDSGATTTVSGTSAQPVFTPLLAGSTHCLHAQDEVGGVWSAETVTCASTPAIQTGTTGLTLPEQPPPGDGGFPVYAASWAQGRTITGFTSAYNLPGTGIAFIKVGNYGATVNPACGDPNALVVLAGGGSLSPSQIAQISWPQPDGTTVFIGCALGLGIPSSLVTNVNWQE